MNTLLQVNCMHAQHRVYVARLANTERTNSLIYRDFLACLERADTRRSHFFEDRYENIYISEARVPAVRFVMQHILQWVVHESGQSASSLKHGFWFNYMLPGEKTLSHTHDDDRELWSAVYYVRVPAHSGRLVLGSETDPLIMEPEEGMAIMFPPNLVHKVTVNHSNEPRLSVGINIGQWPSGRIRWSKSV